MVPARLLRTVHRVLACACILFWVFQAMTGLVLSAYRASQEAVLQLESVGVAGPATIEHALDQAAPARESKSGGHVARLIAVSSVLHSRLAMGWTGRVLIGVSGALMLIQIVVGIRLAARRRGMAPRSKASADSHVRFGMYLGPMAACIILFGVLEAFIEPLSRLSGAAWILAAAERHYVSDGQSSTAGVIRSALFAHPEFALERISNRDGAWEVQLVERPLLKLFPRRLVVQIAADHSMYESLDRDAYLDSKANLLNRLESLHSGQWLWPLGRILSLAVGLWVLWMAGSGGRKLLARYKRPPMSQQEL